ncbi:MAG: EAL domain-containing response regulator [Pusillimonas sp.]|nr:EAL domain-containing response regulator [Pusillimonas sp.]
MTNNTCRLLILDDDPGVGQTIELIARASGFETRFTSSPEDFFQGVDEWQPDHIAIDLIMPEMDGVEVLARLAQRHCEARIIVTSGVDHRVLDAAGRSATERGLNIVGVLPKPFMPSALRKLFDLSEPLVSTGAGERKVGVGPQVYAPDATDLLLALEQDQFFAMYQPKISCFSGDLVGFEALMRWRHPQHGLIPPDRFIASAERTGMIDALTERMLDISLGWFAPRYALSSVRLSINLSARSRLDDTFVDQLLERCNRAGVPADQLIFELTETSAMEDPVASLDLLTRMRMKGFHLSIDDLGTGFSSLLQLVRLPFSELKVDKSFVITAASSSESRQVIQAIVSLGQSLGIQSTAEGVEDAQTLQFLREIGCNFAQGFHIARPMEADRAQSWTHFTLP